MNTVAPGVIVSDMSEDVIDIVGPFVALQRGENRAGKPEEVADVVLFLASEKSGWMTAQYVAVDAGLTTTAI